MNLSAVVLSFNSFRHIRLCVESLVQAFSSLPGPNEIWVVENGSTDGSVEVLRELESSHGVTLHVIYSPRNLGTTVSRNLALRQVTGRQVLVIDSDAMVGSETLASLSALLDANPRFGIVVPRLKYADGRFQLSVDTFPTVLRKLQRLFKLKDMEAEVAVPTEMVEVDYAISALWLFRRSLLDRVGLLDERIFYSPEDVDFCLRVWKAGFSVVYDPTVCAVHDAQELSRKKKLNTFAVRHLKGLAYLFVKHRYALGVRRLYRRIGRSEEKSS